MLESGLLKILTMILTLCFRAVYDNLYEYLDSSTIPHVVVILGEYQYKNVLSQMQK